MANIGLTQLREELGDDAPTGSGISVSQIEAPQGIESQYFVNTDLTDFDGKTITAKQTPYTVSSHATNIGQNLYGNSGIAPGITTADVYEANRWLDSGFLRTKTALPPRVEYRQVQNHSWVGGFTIDGEPDIETATDVLRRIDYMVNRDDVVVVAGVNNGAGTTVPQILGNAYNAIAVGRSDGGSSLGPSTVDVIGRSKPDIVAPGPNVSVSTSWVSGAAALLLETAGASATASRPETIKAVLLAGASKQAFDLDGLTTTTLDDWSRSTTKPLDDRFGAGQLDIYRSHQILSAGQQGPSSLAEAAIDGWDARSIGSGQTLNYFISVPENQVLGNFSVIAAWNREIEFEMGVGSQPATLTPSLANIDLRIYQADGSTAGSLIDESISDIDNVEHLFERVLGPGQYMISVTSDDLTDFSLAWGGQLYLAGDSDFSGRVDGADYIAWANNYRGTNKQFWQGDFDLNGVVDGADYILWANNYMQGTSNVAANALAAVPEPATLGMALLGGLCVVGLCVRKRRR